MASRINRPIPVPVKDNDLDRVQKALTASVQAIANSPTLDSQVLSNTITATTAAQTVSFSHQLGRTPIGLHIVSCTGLVAQVGQHAFTSTTASVTITLAAAVAGSISVVVF